MPAPMDRESPQRSSTESSPPAPNSTAPSKPPETRRSTVSVEAIQQLRRGLSQCLLYSLESRQFEKACEQVCVALKVAIEIFGKFSLTTSSGKAVVNGELLDLAPAQRANVEFIEKMLSAASITTITFEAGLTREELGSFLFLLTRRRFTGLDGSKILTLLRDEHKIEHISVNELRFVALASGEMVVPNDSILSRHAGTRQALAATMESFGRLISMTDDEHARDQIRSEITERLLEQDPEFLKCMLANVGQRLNLSAPEEFHSFLQTPERDQQLVNDVTELAQTMQEAGAELDDPSWEPLRNILERLVQPYRAHSEDLLGRVEFTEVLIPLLPDWLQKGFGALHSGSAQERLEGILTQSPHGLLNDNMFQKIVDIFDEFWAARMYPEAEGLARHVCKAVRALTKAERMKAVKRVSFLLDRSMDQTSDAVRILEDGLLDACTHETCDEVMRMLLRHLSTRGIHHYRQGNYERALLHIEWISSLEESSRIALRDKGANIAQQERDDLSRTQFARDVTYDLHESGERGAAASRIVKILAGNVPSMMIECIKQEPDIQRAQAYAAKLREMGGEAGVAFLGELARTRDPMLLARLLTLAPGVIEEKQLWQFVTGLLKSDAEATRSIALDFIVQQSDEGAFNLLMAAVRDTSQWINREQYLITLAKLRHPPAVNYLLSELDRALLSVDESEAILILNALSNCEDARIVAQISKLIILPSATIVLSSTDMRRPPTRLIVIAALRALARFYKDIRVAELYERARREKDPEIARVANACLKGIIASDQKQAEVESLAESAFQRQTTQTVPLSKQTRATRISRRGFEILESTSKVEDVFKPGAPITGAGIRRETSTLPTPRNEPLVENLTPTFEGKLETHGLLPILESLHARTGALVLQTPIGDAGIYIQSGLIVGAAFAGKRDLAALAGIVDVDAGPIAFYESAPLRVGALSLRPEQIQGVVKQYRLTSTQTLQ